MVRLYRLIYQLGAPVRIGPTSHLHESVNPIRHHTEESTNLTIHIRVLIESRRLYIALIWYYLPYLVTIYMMSQLGHEFRDSYMQIDIEVLWGVNRRM